MNIYHIFLKLIQACGPELFLDRYSISIYSVSKLCNYRKSILKDNFHGKKKVFRMNPLKTIQNSALFGD